MVTGAEITMVESLLAKKDGDLLDEDMDAPESILNRYLKIVSRTNGGGFDFATAKADDPLVDKLLRKYLRPQSKKVG